MRQAFFWIKIFIYIPFLLKKAKRAKSLPFEKKYEEARELADFIVRKLKVSILPIGIENIPLKNGFLFVGNHQGSADAFVFLKACQIPTTAVSKIEGKKVPVLGTWYDVLEMIYFDRDSIRDSIRMINDVKNQLLSGRNVLIFPEGTRSKSQTMNEFKAGSFKPAVMAKAPIVPFAFVNAYIPLNSHEKKKEIKVVFLQPIHYEEYCVMSTEELSKEVQNRIKEAIGKYQ